MSGTPIGRASCSSRTWTSTSMRLTKSAELIVTEVAEEPRARRADGRDTPAALDGRSEGNPCLIGMLPKANLVGEYRRERMLPRLFFAFAERDNLRPVGKPNQPDRILDLDGLERCWHVAMDEMGAAHELAGALGLRAPQLPGHEGDLG